MAPFQLGNPRPDFQSRDADESINEQLNEDEDEEFPELVPEQFERRLDVVFRPRSAYYLCFYLRMTRK